MAINTYVFNLLSLDAREVNIVLQEHILGLTLWSLVKEVEVEKDPEQLLTINIQVEKPLK